MNLSKSKYCRGLQCKKMLWLEKNKKEVGEEIDNSKVLEQGNRVHEVARYLFKEHINIEYTENLKEMIKDTYRTIESYKNIVITEASFNYNNNFCSVDILKKNNEKYEIYEVKSSTDLKDVYINDASYQYYVLTNLGFNVTKCSIVIINNKYERNGNIELDKLFLINDITKKVKDMQIIVEKNINEINKYLLYDEEPEEDIDKHCFSPYPCPFFNYCKRHLPNPNVFDLTITPSITGLKYYKKGILSFTDLLKEDINDKQRQRIEFELNNKNDYVDKEKIKEFLGALSYPLYFLDFETYQMPIPLYNRIHPYEQVPFQYSLHYIEKKGCNLKHKEFLSDSGIDPRRSLAEALVKDIPQNVCTLAYNMKFEKMVIKRLASLYPDLKEHLMNIHDNIKDLMIPFDKRYFYTKEMHGSSSIKKVLPALFPKEKSLDYHNLEQIHNGEEASSNFNNLINMEKEEQDKVRNNLLKYCYLDTYAMVKILEKLESLITDKTEE